MRLRYKINLSSLTILATVSSAIVLSGVVSITKISYDLNRKLMTKEVGGQVANIQAAVEVLQQSGVADVGIYQQRAKADFLANIKRTALVEASEKTGIWIIVRKEDGEPLLAGPANSADKEFLKEVAAQRSGCLSHFYEGESRYFCFDSHDGWGWVVIQSQRKEKLMEVRSKFLKTALIILVLSFGVGSLILLWTTNRIVRPICLLARAADSISRGEWETPLPAANGGDEISKLTQSFRKMSKKLSATYIALNRQLERIKKSQDELSTEKERLAVTLRSIGDGVICTDTEGCITLVNKVAEELTGWSKDDAITLPIEKVFHLVDYNGSEINRKLKQAIIHSGDEDGITGEARLIAKKNLERIISVSVAPISDGTGLALGAILVFRDITDDISIQEELLKAQKLESVGVLAGGIAHDFNNILTSILGNISLSKLHAAKNEELLIKLTCAEKASMRARDLTQQLLTFAKGGEPVKTCFSLKKVIEESTSFALAGSNCRCEYDFAEELWTVLADQGQISRVLHNLIINATQAMPNGGIVDISCENFILDEGEALFLEPGPYIRLKVKDSGIGIPKASLNKIFDPYYTTKMDGSGLGLASVYSIIKKHKGLIQVESKEGEGTVFEMYLPASVKKENCRNKSKNIIVNGSGRVLVVDDNDMIKEVTGKMLVVLGYDTDFADDGKKAIDMYKREMSAGRRYDFVIMDLTIPGGMGGEEAIRRLVKIDSNISAIAISGYANNRIMANFNDYGFSAVIPKPFSIEQLSKSLADL